MWDQGIKSLGKKGHHKAHQVLSWLQNFIFYHLQTLLRHRGVLCTESSPGEHRKNEHSRWEQQPILGTTDQVLTLVILPTKTFSSGDATQYTGKVPSFVSRFYIMILYYELGIDILLCSVKSVTCLIYMWEDSWGTSAYTRTQGGQEPQVFSQHKTFTQILPRLYTPFKPRLQGNSLLSAPLY